MCAYTDLDEIVLASGKARLIHRCVLCIYTHTCVSVYAGFPQRPGCHLAVFRYYSPVMNIYFVFAFGANMYDHAHAHKYTHIYKYLCPATAKENVIMQSTLCVATRLTDASVEQILMDFQSEF